MSFPTTGTRLTAPCRRRFAQAESVPGEQLGGSGRGGIPTSPLLSLPVRLALSAPKSVPDRGSHGTAPTPRPMPPAEPSMPTARAAADRGRNAPSPAKRAGRRSPIAVRSRSRRQAGPSGGSAQPSHRARRSRYIPAAVRREVWRRDGGCCSYVDPHSGRRCGSRFLLELDHIVPFALGGSAEPGNLRVLCEARDYAKHHGTNLYIG